MPDLPSSNVAIDQQTIAAAGGTKLCTIMAPCALNADTTPRLFSSADAILAQHGYSDGVDYAALHLKETKKPVLFVALPIVTPGVVGRKNTSGNSGSSVVDVAAGGSGVLGEHDGVLTVLTGGTIGTSQILLGLSLDGGRTTKRVRLGTGNAYTIPHVGAALSFGAGTLVAGDTILTWHGTAPKGNAAGLTAARTALAAQQKPARTWMVIGDLASSSEADNIVTEVNAYETSNDRFELARAQVRDRLPYAQMSQVRVVMTGNPNLTFADANPDTITRSAGSWVTDGFVAGQIITVAGSVSNDDTYEIASVTATVLTLIGGDTLAAEGPVGDVSVVGTPKLVFAEVGATGDTLTRSQGSWLDDGFRVGDKITVAGTASNNFVGAAAVTGVTATVITFDTDDLTDETIGSYGVTVTAGETKAQHVASMDAAFASVDDQIRIDLGHGRGRKLSPILGYRFRRPVQWAASLREYQHDVHIAAWRVSDGPLDGWDLNDAFGNLVEHDERNDGGALAGRFTCFRTWSNLNGPYLALSLTRGLEGSLLSRTHFMHVANVACRTVHAATVAAVGQNLILNPADGTATSESLGKIRERVNTQLEIELLGNKENEGPRASSADWVPATDDVLNVPEATLNGTLNLLLNGTLEKINTKVRIQTAG